MKTYVLHSTAVKGGTRPSWNDGYWKNYSFSGSDGADRYVGGSGSSESRFWATLVMFDQSELAALREKTIVSVTLNLVIESGTIPSSGTTALPVGYKYNGLTGNYTASDAWARGNADSTEYAYSEIGYLRSASSAVSANNTPLDIDLTGSDIPVYGYVIGAGTTTINLKPKLAQNATLTVVTTEPSTYTVTYDGNGGTGAPAAQTKTEGVDLALSSTVPSRAGYSFAGWNTLQDGTGTGYDPGDTYSADADLVLYAQWTEASERGVWVKGSDGQMHQGPVYVKGSDGQMHQGTVYVKGSDGQMHLYQ